MATHEKEKDDDKKGDRAHTAHRTTDRAKGDKEKAKPGKIKQQEEIFVYCDAEACRYYHECFFDTKEKKFVMPDGHYCADGVWLQHDDVNETDMLVQEPSVTPEGKDLREAYGGLPSKEGPDTHGTKH